MQRYRGVIRYINLEGGAWMLECEGQRYALSGLSPQYQQDGLRVEIEGEVVPSFSFLMAGPTLKIANITTVAE